MEEVDSLEREKKLFGDVIRTMNKSLELMGSSKHYSVPPVGPTTLREWLEGRWRNLWGRRNDGYTLLDSDDHRRNIRYGLAD